MSRTKSEFQQFLAQNPKAGEVIQKTGGLRKIRWTLKGKGKRGGIRIIYYHITADSHIRLLLIYKKGVKENLTEDEKKILRSINERWQ